MNGITIADDKFLRSMSNMAMMVVGSALMLCIVHQLIPQRAQAQAEDYQYGLWFLGPAGHIMNVQNGIDEAPQYVGEAPPGTDNDEPGWRIYKYEYVRDPVSGDILSGTIRYANGNTNFDKIWDRRADYEYL